jgi:hypothetical protein
VRSSASSFNFQYFLFSLRSSSSCLRLLPRLLIIYLLPSNFPSITCFRRQFLRKMWPIQLAFLLFIVCTIFLSSLTLHIHWCVYKFDVKCFPFSRVWIIVYVHVSRHLLAYRMKKGTDYGKEKCFSHILGFRRRISSTIRVGEVLMNSHNICSLITNTIFGKAKIDSIPTYLSNSNFVNTWLMQRMHAFMPHATLGASWCAWHSLQVNRVTLFRKQRIHGATITSKH